MISSYDVISRLPTARLSPAAPQLILKHNAHAHCTNIVEVADGMDFFYQNKSHALKMLDFVSSVLPVRNRGASEKLISADTKSATANVQMTCACPPPRAPPAIIAIEHVTTPQISR